ncbi:flavodoxin family protein [Nocardioides gilvus]|uniref:flavodoxin family protein n=1 Tax=Nocardioides gilvus TaxID=1735589 RepID=UPI000D74A3C3|nr:flavodoxin domain-containing protein [Nocardioides gilvus]
MSTLVVYESMWGNTRSIAEAVAEGLAEVSGEQVPVLDVMEAPAALPTDVDLLVIGGPTHAFSMSRANTRKDASGKGALPGHEARGIREWLEQQPSSDVVDVATFDTRVASVRKLPGSAAKAAGKSVRRHHLGRLIDVESFYVDDMSGPLLDGEVARAQEWGRGLVPARSREGREPR